MLASMTNNAENVPLNWGDLAVSELPTGTVTLLLADVEGSTRLWENHPDMAAAIARLNAVVTEVVARHDGVRPLEQGEGDSFVVAFAKASDAVACALAIQTAALDPIKVRIGVHTGEIALRDESNYAGPTINRTARLRDLAHGGQTVLSGATEAMVLDRLPNGAWLTDLGSHPLRDLPRPERVLQLNHSDLPADFPPLRVAAQVRRSRLPVQLTSFVGRAGQVTDIAQLLGENRLVTLTGAGGAGKTRLALQVAATTEAGFDGAVFFVDLAPITDPALVPVALARALELTDQPGHTTIETIRRFVADRRLLVVLDNCEHLLESCSQIVTQILHAGEQVTVLATSREPVGIPGELTWPVPSLSIEDEAVELFIDRARKAKPDFAPNPQQSATIAEISRRLDGMPLAIELAAARTRTLSLPQILESLRSSFRLLTGGGRTLVRRQQTLSASIDWSHSLLTDTERTLLRRIAVFAGGFDLDAAGAVGANTDAERAQLIDVLGLLVDKSLVVVADDSGADMRYRLLETVRQYSLEKLAASGEADTVRDRHRDYFAASAAQHQSEVNGDFSRLVSWAEAEIDNLRTAFLWSCENADFESALVLVSSLQRMWTMCSRYREGLAGFDAVFSDERYRDGDVRTAVWAGAVADAGQLAVWQAVPADFSRAQEALAVARETGDQRLTARTLMACGMLAFHRAELAGPYLAEAIDIARAVENLPVLCEALGYQTFAAMAAGQPLVSSAAGEEGAALADTIGDRQMSRYCRLFLSSTRTIEGVLDDAVRLAQSVVDDARADDDRAMEALGLQALAQALVLSGDFQAGGTAGAEALKLGDEMGGFHLDSAYVPIAGAALGKCDPAAALQACESAMQHIQARMDQFVRSLLPFAQAAMCCGDLVAARRWADELVATAPGSYQVWALTTRARVAIAQGEPRQAEQDAHDALSVAERTGGYLRVPDALESLAELTASSNPLNAARLLGAANGIRQRRSIARFTVFEPHYTEVADLVRESLEDNVFQAARTEGETLSTAEAIAYAQRGRGERKRPASGWESLTPAELDVISLLSEGLSNKEIAARLFISPRTAQTHLTHIYSKLNLSSRVQVVQEAARHIRPAGRVR
ncbi:MAG: LuxR C-terminal-related transcriptional regulator [Mycobacterium sp.]